MSNESNNTNIETKKENDKTKNLNTGKNKDKKPFKPLNAIFYCEICKRIPLIIFSEKMPKIIKYCENENKTELINPNHLLNMINIKHSKKKDTKRRRRKKESRREKRRK